MSQVTSSIFDLPSIVIDKIIKMLESQDILWLSSTCKYFYSIITNDYYKELILPISDFPIPDFPVIQRKRVLKMQVNLTAGGECKIINWKKAEVNALNTNKIVKQIKCFNTKEVVELCINIDCSEIIIPPQEERDYNYLIDMIKDMMKLRRCRIDINSTVNDSRMAFIHYIHVGDILQFCKAKEILVKFPQILNIKHKIPLALSNTAEKITLIGPCQGLFTMSNDLFCVNVKELVVKPSSKHCMFGDFHDSTLHNNGICVVNVKTKLQYSPNIQYYNNVFVGDSYTMKDCCYRQVLAERFYEDYQKRGGVLSKEKWLSYWHSFKPFRM